MAEKDAIDQLAAATESAVTATCAADPTQALVIAASPVNRIVLSRIAQRAYLRVQAMDPEEARRILSSASPRSRPGLVIVDIDAQVQPSDTLFLHLEQHRNASPRRLPLVITIIPSRLGAVPQAEHVDAHVVRPVTPEALQPVIQRLLTALQT
ncbi:response regulator [Nitratireductor kimnyeongensis]|uniref:Response regulator n=1 Tax=Nitratireductor kimnyeongensis TaxID=430679 RepID=A0ABW0T6T8_9HYPH|nr:response regulator [Nitratireductor kimnyeongensis]QZZ34504.1 response regulator [Nitratireductor kimnyeongensis]